MRAHRKFTIQYSQKNKQKLSASLYKFNLKLSLVFSDNWSIFSINAVEFIS